MDNDSATTHYALADNGDIKPEVTWYRIVLGFFLYLIVLVTIFGNGLVLAAIIKNKEMHTVFNVFIVNLAITDISVGLVDMNLFAIINILQYWPFGQVICGIFIFCDYGITFASIFTLLTISIDRYWSVHWSNHYRLHNTPRKAAIATMCIWLAMIILWGTAFAFDRYYNRVDGKCFYDPDKNKLVVIVVAVVGYHLSTVIIIYCYVSVYIFIRNRNKLINLYKKPFSSIANTDASITTFTLNQLTSASAYDVKNSGERNVSRGDLTEATTSYPSKDVVDHTVGMKTTTKMQVTVTSASRKLLRPSSATVKPSTPDENVLEGKKRHLVLTVELAEPDLSQLSASRTFASDLRLNKSGSESSIILGKTFKREQKVFRTLTYIIVCYAICWIPFHVCFDLLAINKSLVPQPLYYFVYWLSYLNSTCNPFLYNFSSKDFHRAYRKLLGLK